jgi:hypothetical protein
MEPNYDRYKRSKKHEERLAKRLGGRRLPQSGAKQASKSAFAAQMSLERKAARVTLNGDFDIGDFWVEHKRTETDTISIKREWWLKVSDGARSEGKEPAIMVTFERKAKPGTKPIDLVLIPLEVFERLRGRFD